MQFHFRSRGEDTIAKVAAAFKKDDVIKGCFPRVYKFLIMNDKCTILRTSLTQRSLDALIRVYSMSTTVKNFSDDDLNDLVDKFKAKKNREMLL